MLTLLTHFPELFPEFNSDMKWVLLYIGSALAGIPATHYLGSAKPPPPSVLLLGSLAGPLTLLLAATKWVADRVLVGELPRE